MEIRNIIELPAKTLFTPREVADFFSVTTRTIYNWCEEGKLKYAKVGGVIRIYRFSIIEILNPLPLSLRLEAGDS